MLFDKYKYFRLLHNPCQSTLDRIFSHRAKSGASIASCLLQYFVDSLQTPIGDLIDVHGVTTQVMAVTSPP